MTIIQEPPIAMRNTMATKAKRHDDGNAVFAGAKRSLSGFAGAYRETYSPNDFSNSTRWRRDGVARKRVSNSLRSVSDPPPRRYERMVSVSVATSSSNSSSSARYCFSNSALSASDMSPKRYLVMHRFCSALSIMASFSTSYDWRPPLRWRTKAFEGTLLYLTF